MESEYDREKRQDHLLDGTEWQGASSAHRLIGYWLASIGEIYLTRWMSNGTHGQTTGVSRQEVFFRQPKEEAGDGDLILG